MCRHRVFWVNWLCGNGRNPPFSLELMFHCVSRYLVIGADACVVCVLLFVGRSGWNHCQHQSSPSDVNVKRYKPNINQRRGIFHSMPCYAVLCRTMPCYATPWPLPNQTET